MTLSFVPETVPGAEEALKEQWEQPGAGMEKANPRAPGS